MATVFTKIVNGELPCHKIAETVDFLAFLDISPLTKGHTLVITKKEIDYIFNMDDGLYKGLFLFAKSISKAIEKVVECKRIGIAVIGLEVPHVHIHLIPINNIGDINFSREKLKLSEEELSETARKIQSIYSSGI